MKELNADIIVVGGGPTGLAAALRAAESGAGVIIFEKSNRIGGCGNMAMGLFAVESRLQREMQFTLTREDIFKRYMEWSHWGVDARLVRTFINRSAGTIDWLENLGVEFVGVESHGIGNLKTWHLNKPAPGSKTGMGSSAVMMNILAEKAKDLGVRIMLKTPGKQLIKEKNKITGIIAEDADGKEIRAKARAVIIGTGGFGSSPEWIKKHTRFEIGKDLFQIKIPNLTGDGISMAWEAGAAESQMILQHHFRLMGATPGNRAIGAAFRQPNLVVNLSGERFMNEDVLVGNTFLSGNALALQKDRCAFSIMDENTINHFMEKGLDFETAYGVALSGVTPKPVDFDKQFEDGVAKGTEGIYVADSLEELAEKTGINPDGLLRNIAEYNHSCETGRDELFDRNPRYLRPVKKPRFYCLKCVVAASSSLGGIRINYRTEVLDNQNNTIPGLYAAGADAEAIYGDTYNISIPGSTLGFAVNSGCMAGENAVEYIKK